MDEEKEENTEIERERKRKLERGTPASQVRINCVTNQWNDEIERKTEREREREGEKGRKRGRERKGERDNGIAGANVCVTN